MKKLIVLLIVAVIMLVATTVTMAATIYVDGAVNAQMDNSHGKWAYNPVYIGADIPLGIWKISAEYSPETKWYQKIENVSGYIVKVGPAFICNDDMRIGFNVGAYYQNFRGPNYHYRYDKDLMVGLDGTFKLSDNVILDLAYDDYHSGYAREYSLKYDVAKITTYKIKLSYLLDDNWGLSLGYRSLIEQAVGWNKFTYGTVTAGVSYNF